jgi:cytochrome c551/c552
MKHFKCLLPLAGLAVSLLGLTTDIAHAEWQLIDDNYLAKVYFDPNKMKKSTSYPEVWQMTDLKSRASTGANSRLILLQYDCVDKRRRTLASAGYATHMAQGKPIFTDVSQGSWHPVAKDTVMNTVMEIACAKDEGQGAEHEFQKSEILEEMKH